LTAIVMGLGVFLRLFDLGSDPQYYDWVGYVTDEGRWVHAARSLLLHGSLPTEGLGQLHLVLAPVYQAASYALFSVVGVSLTAARLLAAVCGCLTLLVFWLMLRRVVLPHALLLGLALLAVQTDLLVLSRMAIPEAPALFLELLAYWALTCGATLRGALLTLAAIGTKGTAAPFVVVGSAISAVSAPGSVPDRPRARLRRVVIYGASVVAPPAVLGLIALALLGRLDSVAYSWRVIGTMFGLADAYTIVSYPFSGSLASTVNLWALGLWISALVLLTPRDAVQALPERRHLVASMVWVCAFLPVMVGLSYFPTRYQSHVLVPLAVNLVCALSAVLRMRPERIIQGIAARGGWGGAAVSLLLVVPTAAFLAPTVAQVWAVAGADPFRLSTRVIAFASASGLLWVIAGAMRRSGGVTSLFLYVPVLMAPLIGLEGVIGETFWPDGTDRPVLLHAVALAGAGAIAWAVRAFDRESSAWQGLITTVAVGVVAILLVSRADAYLNPQYSIVGTSATIETDLRECEAIRALNTEGLFTSTSLAYRSYRFGETSDCLLAAFMTQRERDRILEEFVPVRTYSLFVPESYCANRRRLAQAQSADEIEEEMARVGCPLTVELFRPESQE
jgi:hypothetical protein